MAVALLLSAPAFAQTQTCPTDCRFSEGAPVSLTWTHDPTPSTDGQKAAATGYRVLIDHVQVGADIPVTALVAGTVAIPGIVLPSTDATHTYEVVAFNADLGTSSTSKALTFTIGPPLPRVPTNLKIIGTLTSALGADGLWHFTLALNGDQQ